MVLLIHLQNTCNGDKVTIIAVSPKSLYGSY